MKFNPDLAKRENARVKLEAKLEGQVQPPKTESPVSTPTNPEKYWTIENVNYLGITQPVHLLKELLHSGAARTQDEWASQYDYSKPKGEFHAPDFPLLYATIKALSTSSGKEVEEARNFIRDTSRDKWHVTLTRVHYNPSAKSDRVTHLHGTVDSFNPIGMPLDFVGNDEYLKDTKRVEPYQALLNTSDGASEIDGVFNWLNGTGAYMWRANAREGIYPECVAGFGADSGRANLVCYRYPQVPYPALGFRLVKNLGGKS